MNSGMAFGRGNLTAPQLITTGYYQHPTALGANSATTVNISFGITYPSIPFITLGTQGIVAASFGVVVTFQGQNFTGFNVNFYNSRSVTAPANTFGLNWMAIGNN